MSFKYSRHLAAVAVSALVLGVCPAANAEPSPVTGVELNVDVADSVAVATQYNMGADASEGLAALKELRRKMWKLNPPMVPIVSDEALALLPAKPRLRDVAKLQGVNSLEEYLDVEIDSELMRIAVQRALENQAFPGVDIRHQRPDGTHPSTVTTTRNTWAESLGVSVGARSLKNMVLDSWGGSKEYNALVASGGQYNSQNGHLFMLIEPKHKAFGFARVRTPGEHYYFSAYAFKEVLDSSPLDDEVVTAWNYRAPAPGEKATGLKKGAPKFVAPTPPGGTWTGGAGAVEGSGGGGLMGIITAIVSVLSILAAVAQFAGQFMPRPR